MDSSLIPPPLFNLFSGHIRQFSLVQYPNFWFRGQEILFNPVSRQSCLCVYKQAILFVRVQTGNPVFSKFDLDFFFF